MASDSPDYYPFRWKVADAVEDLFVLHRRKLVAAAVLLLAGIGIGAIIFVENGNEPVETANQDAPGDSSSTTSGPTSTTATTIADESGSTTTASTTSSTTSSTTTSTTTEAPVPTRPAASPEQIAAAQPGAILEMDPGVITLVGGLPSDAVANETVTLAEALFPDAEVVDEQIVDATFPNPESIVFRLSAPDLFGYNSDELNPAYLPLVDQLAAAMIAAESWTVNVTGHTDDTGPELGNQRLSERRAQSGANRLTAQGVDATRVTVTGAGESQPIAPNDTEAGRLANRRIEFVIDN